MFEGIDLGNINKMMEQMQQKAKEFQEQAKKVELTAKAGGGLVEIKANGEGEVIDLMIDKSLLEDKEALQILLISAINDINKMVEDNKKSQAMNMMGDFNLFGASS